MTVRVVRVIEIEYPDQASYERDRLHWTLPANGERQFGGSGPVYRTATFLSQMIGGPELTGEPEIHQHFTIPDPL